MAARGPAVCRVQKTQAAAIPGDQSGGEGVYSPGQGGRTRRLCPVLAGQRQRRRRAGKSGGEKDVLSELCTELYGIHFLLLFSRPVVSDSLPCHGLQHTRLPILHCLPELPQIHIHCVSEAIQPSHPLSSPSPPAFFLSSSVFPNESALCIRWPKYWSFSFSISPSSEHSGLISFRIDWFDHLTAQGTLKSLLTF